MTVFKIGQPRFLSLDEVLTLHLSSLEAYGGVDGILDQGKLDASLAMPRQGFTGEFAHDFPFGMAAAYGFHLSMNHAFRDGNKRTAFAAMVVFLRMNGWNFELADDVAATLMLQLIEERRDKAWLAARLMEVSRARPSFELRDFFSVVDAQDLIPMLEGFLADPMDAARHQTINEAAAALPLVRQFRSFSQAMGESGNEPMAGKCAFLALALVVLFRVAEDMGYEW